MARRNYGYDPYAAQITGAANTIMQGLGMVQDMQWQQEQRGRQREQWEKEDQAEELYGILMHGTEQPQGEASPDTKQQPQKSGVGLKSGPVQSQPTSQARSAPQGVGLQKKVQQNAPSQALQTGSPSGSSPSVPGGAQRGAEGQDQSDPLLQAADPLKRINERLEKMDLSQYDPAAVRKAKAQAIQDTIDEIQFSRENMMHNMQKWEMERERLYPQALEALRGLQRGDKNAIPLGVEVANKLPNGRKFQLDKEGENILIWDVADEKTPENAEKIPVAELTYEQAKDFIMPSLDPQTYHKQMIADLQAAKEFNREQYTNPHVFETENGERLYVAQTIDRRNDNKLRTVVSSDPFMDNAVFADQLQGEVDFNKLKHIGRAEDIEESEKTMDVGGKEWPISEMTPEMKNTAAGLSTGKEGEKVNIPGVGPMKRSEARQGLKTLFDTLKKADSGVADVYAMMRSGDMTEEQSELAIQRVSRLAKESESQHIRDTAKRALDYMQGLFNIKSPFADKQPPGQSLGNRGRQESQERPRVVQEGVHKQTGKTIYKLSNGQNILKEDYERLYGKQ